jgi:hypothetical protein
MGPGIIYYRFLMRMRIPMEIPRGQIYPLQIGEYYKSTKALVRKEKYKKRKERKKKNGERVFPRRNGSCCWHVTEETNMPPKTCAIETLS